MSPTWPLEVLNTMTLTEHNGKTTMTISGYPMNATDEERKTFDAGHDSMNKGWSGTMEQLAGYLATAKGSVADNISRAMVYGSVTASFCCEGFGLNRTTKTKRADIEKRVKELERLTKF